MPKHPQKQSKQPKINTRREITQAELDSVKSDPADWKFILQHTNSQARTDISMRGFQSPGAKRRTQVQRGKAVLTGLMSRARRNKRAKQAKRVVKKRDVKRS